MTEEHGNPGVPAGDLPLVLDLAGTGWTVRTLATGPPAPAPVRGRVLPAAVPGCVHTDLVAAGLLVHPDRGRAEEDGRWIGDVDWRYATTFELDDGLLAHDRVELVVDGLDTVATLAVNGRGLGEAASMHHPHRFDLRAAGRGGANTLAVDLRGPVAYAEAQSRRLGPRPVNGDWGPYQFVRKPACNFGWDWGPRVPTAGIAGSIAVVAWSVVRIAAVRPLVTSATRDRATLEVHVDAERVAPRRGAWLTASLEGPDGRRWAAVTRLGDGDDHAIMHLTVDEPARWWPRTHGAQPLSTLVVEVVDPSGVVRDRWQRRIGLRTVTLDVEPDEDGTPFRLLVNGVPVTCLGANWIPEGLFPADRTEDRIRRRVEQAAGANMNMLRVWGGGRYESEAFYGACDEAGILVWQDFMFACAMYPEEPPYPSLIEAEARYQVTRLAAHPSVALWCGGNENFVAHESWGWKEQMAPDCTWGRSYWLELLPGIVAALDPTRPYWPDSPWSGDESRHPNDPDHGDRHTWDRRLDGYRDLVPRFVSEFGHQAPPNWPTLLEALGPAALAIDGADLEHRQRATGGSAGQYADVGSWFGPTTSFDGWHRRAQVLQARAIAIGIEWLRAHGPRCAGALIWQLNDAWTGHSWSAIDVAGRPKPLWYALRRACAPRLLTVHPVAGAPTLFAVNDTDEPWRATLRARRVDFDGPVRAEAGLEPVVAPRRAVVVADLQDLLGPPGRSERELLVIDDDEGRRATWLHGRDRELAWPAPRLRARGRRHGDAVELTLTAETLVHELVLAADRLDPDADVEDQLLTLLPGETATVRVRTRHDLDLDRLLELSGTPSEG